MTMEVKKPSSSDIKSLIDIISHIQEKFSEIGEKTGDTIVAFQNNKMLEAFKMYCSLHGKSTNMDGIAISGRKAIL